MLTELKALIPHPLKYRLAILVDKTHRDRRARRKLLSSAKTVDDVRVIARDLNFGYFTDYDAQVETKRREFRSAVRLAGVDLAGKIVVDVGPGTADSLDTAREMGAKRTLFIDEEPFFVKFGQVKGHHGVQGDYYRAPYFPAEWAGTADFLYTKGSINCGWVNQQHALREARDNRGHFDFAAWVVALKKLVARGGSIVLLPSMPRQQERLIDRGYDLDTYYWCPDVQAYRNSFFSRTLVDQGFSVVDSAPGLLQEKAFPLAFVYRQS